MKNLLLLILLFCCGIACAQGYYYDDAQVRGHISIEKKINKFSISLDQQYRFTNNVSELTRASFDIGLGYRIIKQIRVQADYVYIQKMNKSGSFVPRHWYSLAAIFKQDFRRWKFQYRNMLQLRYGAVGSETQTVPRLFDRNKVSVKYEMTKRFTPYVAGEVYIPLNSPQVKGIERTRAFIGLLINTFRHQQLELYFMHQMQWQKNRWYKQSESYPDMRLNRDYIYGIGYSFVF